ncbi:hypothetical protein CDD83_5828 [Cordyceps sp. RAO-2017]|nr:hypothetical protein CDD83_5828 [Cordyceps sp. RAO-2017]
MQRAARVAAAAYLAVGGAASVRELDLAAQQWTLLNAARNISVPGAVPSHVHLDLLRAGVIEEPNLGLNDFDLRWVALSDWTYVSQIEGL